MGCLCCEKDYNIFEINERINEEDQKKYARELDALEIYVSQDLDKDGHVNYYFPTGYDDILYYIKDKFITVMAYQDNERKIRGASYITQGQGLYTYNDLTKYFKFNDEYKEYAKSKYDPKDLFSIEYNTYMKKIKGYKYAKELIMEEKKEITDLVEYCKNEKKNGTFDEKNEVREKVNRYIYNYFRDHDKDGIGFTELERFYLLKFSDLLNCEDSVIKAKCKNETKENRQLYKEYDDLLDLFDLKDSIITNEREKDIEYFKPEDYKNFFDANPFNTIELDTYIVHPDYRKKGIATILTLEGFKIQKKKLLKKRPDLKEIFISATIHRDNFPSKRVLLRIGEFKALYVKRRTNINREVFFYRIKREDLERTMSNIEILIRFIKDNLNNKEQNIKKEN